MLFRSGSSAQALQQQASAPRDPVRLPAGPPEAQYEFAYGLLLQAQRGQADFGPAEEAMKAIKVDESKVVPLALFNGIVGVMVVGFWKWGTPTGGFYLIPEGDYAFQHAEINPLWQLIGVVAIFVVSAIPALIMCLILEKTTGLRVSEAEETHGTDEVEWGSGTLTPVNSGD